MDIQVAGDMDHGEAARRVRSGASFRNRATELRPVAPAGVFQPAALAPAHQRNDFSLWRNVQREFSEEFLGNAEHDGNSIDPISYDTEEPFVSFERARQAGDFQVFACAVVLEPLTLWVELLTVAVIAAPSSTGSSPRD